MKEVIKPIVQSSGGFVMNEVSYDSVKKDTFLDAKKKKL
jgi:hypothetical protein